MSFNMLVMDPAKHVSYWRSGANEDMDAARDMIERRHFRHGLFFAHLAVEKTRKGLICAATGEMPPRSHDLLRLAALAGIEVPADRSGAMAKLARYCMEGRYPETWAQPPDEVESKRMMAEATELMEWLDRKF